jgi:tRNA(Ile)-lysidine synthase
LVVFSIRGPHPPAFRRSPLPGAGSDEPPPLPIVGSHASVPAFAGRGGSDPDAAPLTDGELDALFAAVAAAERIALAVSGGPDSLALLDAADRWRKSPGQKPAVIVLTVDHGLREGSATEARGVALIARQRGLGARVLTRKGERPVANVEAAARAARYGLLFAAARKAGATHVLTAHHREDQAETFVMRLARGAGVFGLAAMRREVRASGLTLVRPFLDVARTRLAATTAAAGLVPVDDPMNADPRYLRTRVRRTMSRLATAGIGAARLAELAARMGDAATAIDAAATALLASAVAADALAVATLDPAGFRAAPSDVRLRALSRLLVAIGGDDYPPRYARLAGLADALAAHAAPARFKRTLGGVVIEARAGGFLFYRELGRVALPTLALRRGSEARWDHRFAVKVACDAPAGLSLSALGDEGRRALERRPDGVPAAAMAAIPAVRRRGRVVAVPSLGLGDRAVLSAVTVRSAVDDRLANPPLFPDFLT